MKKLILASASPRRREILSRYNKITLEIKPADADETLPCGISPAEAVEMLALRKCAAALENMDMGNAVVLAADTVVSADGTILGKPRSREEARDMLKMLSGRAHEVYSGYALSDGAKTASGVEVTRVYFRELDEAEINAYIDTNEPMDKAGGYGIQGLGGIFVSAIEGDYYNVVGLPLYRVARALTEEFGISLI